MSQSNQTESEANKALIRRYGEEIWNKGHLTFADEIIAPNFIAHFPGLPEFKGVDGFKKRFSTMQTAFPDNHFYVEDLLADGDKVVARWTIRGTHTGQMEDIAPTGKVVTWTAIVIYCIAEGKITEMWGEVDNIGLMQQLGTIPS